MSASSVVSIPTTHPALDGHFPGNPVVPAVVLIAEIEKAMLAHWPDYRFCGLERAKFLHPVRPEVTLMIEFAVHPTGIMRVKASAANTPVFEGHFALHSPEAE